MKFNFGRIKGELRTHRVIVKKNNSNQTCNFSLYKCTFKMSTLKKKFTKILVKDTEEYFQCDVSFIEDWAVNRKLISHAITVQDTRISPRKSFTLGIYLHDFDTDEIRDVLMDIFCGIGKNNGGK